MLPSMARSGEGTKLRASNASVVAALLLFSAVAIVRGSALGALESVVTGLLQSKGHVQRGSPISFRDLAKFLQESLDANAIFGTRGSQVQCYFNIAVWNANYQFTGAFEESCKAGSDRTDSSCAARANGFVYEDQPLPRDLSIEGAKKVDIAIMWFPRQHFLSASSSPWKDHLMTLEYMVQQSIGRAIAAIEVKDMGMNKLSGQILINFQATYGKEFSDKVWRAALLMTGDPEVGAISAPHGGIIKLHVNVKRGSEDPPASLTWLLVSIPDILF